VGAERDDGFGVHGMPFGVKKGRAARGVRPCFSYLLAKLRIPE
jgi:hypothetical protein